MEDLFGTEVIHSYGDEQAMEDGILVDLTGWKITFRRRPVNRMTRTLLVRLLPFLIDMNDPLANAPVTIDAMTAGRWTALKQTIKTKLKYARDTAQPGEEPGYLFQLPGGGEEKIWLIQNETGGWTVMFASDY